MTVYVAPICKVPNCTKDSQILSKTGDNIRYMTTCSKHWNELIPKEVKVLLKGIENVRTN
jgi:hypothetical protein